MKGVTYILQWSRHPAFSIFIPRCTIQVPVLSDNNNLFLEHIFQNTNIQYVEACKMQLWTE